METYTFMGEANNKQVNKEGGKMSENDQFSHENKKDGKVETESTSD